MGCQLNMDVRYGNYPNDRTFLAWHLGDTTTKPNGKLRRGAKGGEMTSSLDILSWWCPMGNLEGRNGNV